MNKHDKPVLLIYGAGKVGIAVGHLLRKKAYRISGVVARSERSLNNASQFIPRARLILSSDMESIREVSTDSNIILITTRDEQIESTCNRLVENRIITEAHTVIHMSGAIGLAALAAAETVGAEVASIHPIQSLASVELAIEKLPGSYFGATAKETSYDLALSIIKGLGGKPIDIADECKPVYHAAACVASNYLVALIDLACRIYSAAGIPNNVAIEAMMPLLKGTVSNVEELGTEQALTGPIARGDAETIARHIKSMETSMGHQEIETYKILGRQTIGLAIRKGSIDTGTAAEILCLLKYCRHNGGNKGEDI